MADFSAGMIDGQSEHAQMITVLTICEFILDGAIPIIDGCAMLVPHGQRAGLDYMTDNDFRVLYNVFDEYSQIFPAGRDRHLYSSELLARRDKEKAEAEAFYEKQVKDACTSIHERFKHLIPKDEED